MSVKTRCKTSKKFAGPPCILDKTEPPTLRQVIQYSYFLENTYPDLKHDEISKLITKEIIDIWKLVNPQLPLLREHYIKQKVDRSCINAKQLNRKSLNVIKVKNMTEKLERLFDISSCCCELPILKCDDYAVKCKIENCQTRHIVCTCPLNKKVMLILLFFLYCFI